MILAINAVFPLTLYNKYKGCHFTDHRRERQPHLCLLVIDSGQKIKEEGRIASLQPATLEHNKHRTNAHSLMPACKHYKVHIVSPASSAQIVICIIPVTPDTAPGDLTGWDPISMGCSTIIGYTKCFRD